jgi:hypothetical protein
VNLAQRAGCCCLTLLGALPAAAHTLSESHSVWHIDGATVRVEVIVPDLEAKRLSPSGRDAPTREALAAYLADHVGAGAAAQPCPAVTPPQALAASPGFWREEFQFHCLGSTDLHLQFSAFFDLVPSHTDFAHIESARGDLSEQLFTAGHRDIRLSGAGAEERLQNAGFATFVAMGIMHIFTGVDHMSFMLGLVLISRRVRDLLFVVTGFTLGHSLTLALAVTGVLRPDPQYIDALVALTIALIGAENIGDSTHRPLPVALGLGGLLFVMAALEACGAPIALPLPLLLGGALFSGSYLMLTGQLGDAARVRLLVTLVFGLIHGFGFASNLLEMRLPADRLASLLVGFNIGVELGQITVVLGALTLVGVCVKLRLTVPRPLFTDIAASLLVGEGLFWFLGRSVSLG